MQETWVLTLSKENHLDKGMAIHSSILAWRFHGQRSLVGCKELDTTEQLILSFFTFKFEI